MMSLDLELLIALHRTLVKVFMVIGYVVISLVIALAIAL